MIGNETVLIIEDDEALRTIAAEILQGAGYTVLEADSPQQAMGIATQSDVPIQLVIADVVLPVRSGP
jgi:two-component system, cell cycle sensor histidine kinase and response regulator CckA